LWLFGQVLGGLDMLELRFKMLMGHGQQAQLKELQKKN